MSRAQNLNHISRSPHLILLCKGSSQSMQKLSMKPFTWCGAFPQLQWFPLRSSPFTPTCPSLPLRSKLSTCTT